MPIASRRALRLIVATAMTTASTNYLDVGIYTVPEAARLTGVSESRIRRWLKGYHSHRRNKNYSALWRPQLPQIGKRSALSFLDLIEIKFVGAFLDRGLSWPVIHKVREKAARMAPGVSHPFCTRQFFTDGEAMFMEVQHGVGQFGLLDMTTNQQVFGEITRPFVSHLEYKNGTLLERWWPLGTGTQIVVDPRKNFGQPTLAREGMATRVIAEAVRATGSPEEVARWYEIGLQSVRDAVTYEQSLGT